MSIDIYFPIPPKTLARFPDTLEGMFEFYEDAMYGNVPNGIVSAKAVSKHKDKNLETRVTYLPEVISAKDVAAWAKGQQLA